MNKFDLRYIIRMANKQDITMIMKFIENEWSKNHILATDRDFFEYEHVIDQDVTFILAIERETLELEGICGYLPASRCLEQLDVWGVLWKVRNSNKNVPFLGIELMRRMKSALGARTELGVGANSKTAVPLLKGVLKYNVYKMKHYYALSEKSQYEIAVVDTRRKREKYSKNQTTLLPLQTIKDVVEVFDFENVKIIPHKDAWYFDKRYFMHPIYKYHVCGIEEGGKVKALIVFRIVKHNNAKIIRIVDFIGAQKCFSGLYDEFTKFLSQYEYIDFYCYGFDKSYILAAGLFERTDEDSNIIPNYFEPFVQKNVDIWVDSSHSNCLFFKADGDQDRPNWRGYV